MSTSMTAIREERPVVVDEPARLVTITKQSGAPDLQMFDSSAINAQIDRQMQILPADKTVAAIAYVDKDGASVALVGRISKVPGEATWTVLGTRKWSGNWTASAALRWSI
jgi:hypothetical protein